MAKTNDVEFENLLDEYHKLEPGAIMEIINLVKLRILANGEVPTPGTLREWTIGLFENHASCDRSREIASIFRSKKWKFSSNPSPIYFL